MALDPQPHRRLDEFLCGKVVARLTANESALWVVGGAVRDLLLGRQPREIDLLTESDAMKVADEIADEVIESHARFGTAKFTTAGCLYDIAQTRTETYAAPGALPTVTLGASVAQDLARRDFTVNAIAMRRSGELLEHPGARADLDAGVLRVLHGKSFIDDPTRLWRLVRYSVRLGFGVEPETGRLATAAVNGGALETVSGDRIGSEVRLALREPDALGTLHAALNLGLTPPLNLDPSVIATALEILPDGGRRDLVVLGAAIADDAWVSTLGFSAAELSILRDCIGVTAPAGPPSAVAAKLRELPDEAVALAGARGDREAAERWLLQWRDVRLEIDGNDLIENGILPGPEVGRRLARTLDSKLDGELSGRAAELAAALA